ncbi:isoprenylcysteine carboxylmethyltransferase family protein [Aggregatilineales bacterium SYSU G02658]
MRSSYGLVIVQFGLLGAFVLATVFVEPVGESPVKLLGVVAFLAGVVVFGLALQAYAQTNATLPQVLPDPKQGTQLVQRGIYGSIRHPIYTAVLAITGGVALYHGALIPLALWGALLVLFYVKSDYEESLLRRTFPDYAAYRKRAGRFLPKL